MDPCGTFGRRPTQRWWGDIVIAGILLPVSVLYSTWFGILSAFVAVNTVMYVTLAVLKMLPRLHPAGWFRKENTRSETRSIYPDAPIGGPPARLSKRDKKLISSHG